MGYKSYLLRCSECEHEYEDLLWIPSDAPEAADAAQVCTGCGKEAAFRAISVPNFMSPSIHVGVNEFKNDTKRQRLIEANKLEKQAFNLPREKRGEINKEIKRLKSTTGDNKP